jgi:peptidoglycan/xylan/chitin deacetylase (PgdA/CDA1 family)
MPILRRLEVPATFFVVSRLMKGVDQASRMTSKMLTDLVSAGMEIGGHTRTHPDLASLSRTELDEEIGGCKRDLEGILGKSVRFFAYPGGRHSQEVIDSVQRHGYAAACSVIPAERNRPELRYRLSRDVLSPRVDTFRDRILLHPTGRFLWRAARVARSRQLRRED